MNTFTAQTDAVGGSLALSALVATLPLLAFFIMLLGVKARAHTSAIISLAVAILVAVFGFKMPLDLSLMSAVRGGIYGLFPIVWVILMAIWFYQVTVVSGRFEDLRRTFDRIGGGDLRIQAILIAFCFGGLLEALAGFGAPVAITATMILALGVKPLKAATTVLIANTAPVAFGAVAIPITTAGEIGGRDAVDIAAIVGHQAPFLAFFVPFILLWILDGVRGLKDAWVPAAVIGFSFAVAQWWASVYFAYQLTDVVACIVSLGAAVAFLQVWKPKGIAGVRERYGLPAELPAADHELTGMRIWMALMPYAVVVIIFGVANLYQPLVTWLKTTAPKIPMPLLKDRLLNDAGEPIKSVYSFAWLGNPGTYLLIAGLIVTVIYLIFNEKGRYAFTFGDAIKEIFTTAYRMRWTALTIACVLALAYVMNYSGQTVAIGEYVASLGTIYALLAPVLGWVGTAVTGSDTSANALFGKLQVTAAENLQANGIEGASPELMLAANTTGGVVGKMISPQSLAIAATSVQMEGKESEIFKSVLPWSFILLAAVCVLVFLQSNILHWMVAL
ncbi:MULTISPECIES: L-lactate permease [unclassified Rothia (in: high G+C Gram-positive bacteria)]|uniref:L-lactate permease n=1 Tax=unclassified Rothia (in: high G+C Gram-positive bacteria) TaxID=2689056 RepID=UPI00195A86A0|nr:MULTISPECIES: L-lactate permease [unclassified Rothia (in: high G+C Gram-positive bacteria)]MBM7051996.1 L-lactate permease [Rothia sp. ZJ1223]QRZ61943.1 L-lactate permease [Rothia sp. ZJ932]